MRITRDLIRAGQLPKLEVLDHVIMDATGTPHCESWDILRSAG